MKPIKPLSVASSQPSPTAGYPSDLQSSRGVFGAVTSVSCEQCQTAEYLVYEHVNQVFDQHTGITMWNVECWCGKCEQFYAVHTTTQPEATFRYLQPRSTLSSASKGGFGDDDDFTGRIHHEP